MARIKLLDETVSSRIAAGEVVQRPASVVKELIENSIDAGATSVSVSIKDGGISSIRVSDNGVGIEKEDLPLTIVKHATSKISNVADLDRIFSMGFRGEALFSVATVSKLTITSRVRRAESGYTLTAREGKIINIEPCGVGEGTTVIANELFYNTPARLKFLSAPAKEAAAVSAMVAKLILAYPNVSIKYTSGDKTLYHSPGTGVADAMISVFGLSVRDKIMQVESQVGESSLTGFVSKPPLFEKSPKYKFTYINNRYVDGGFLSRVVSEAYGQRILKGEYPFYCLYFTLPYEDVDVNVHPNKLDVRFAMDVPEHLVMQGISDAIGGLASPTFSLGKSKPMGVMQGIEILKPVLSSEGECPTHVDVDLRETVGFTEGNSSQNIDEKPYKNTQNDNIIRIVNEENTEKKPNLPLGNNGEILEKDMSRELNAIRNMMSVAQTKSQGLTLHQHAPLTCDTAADEQEKVTNNAEEFTENYELDFPAEFEESVAEEDEQTTPLITEGSDFTFVGSAFNTYLIVEHADTLYFVDQHAAHERIMYDKLTSAQVVSQQLLVAEVVRVSHDVELKLESNKDMLFDMGFEYEEFGTLTYKFSSLPALLGNCNFAEVLADLLSELEGTGKPTLLRDRLASRACRLAVKAGTKLTHTDALQIVRDISQGGHIPHCPHGRPVAIATSKADLERGFRRRV